MSIELLIHSESVTKKKKKRSRVKNVIIPHEKEKNVLPIRVLRADIGTLVLRVHSGAKKCKMSNNISNVQKKKCSAHSEAKRRYWHSGAKSALGC